MAIVLLFSFSRMPNLVECSSSLSKCIEILEVSYNSDFQ